MDRTIIRIILLASSLWGIYPLEITNLSVPTFVKNGTEDAVLLDCEYDYDESDKMKMVIKWFHNNDRFPVYQWIPEYQFVEVTQKFGDRVSKDYELPTGDDYTKRRALYLLRPTTEMSGLYSCQVASLSNSDHEESYMTIYATPTGVHMNISSVDDTLYLTCMAQGVFPLPEIELFHVKPGKVNGTRIEEVSANYVEYEDSFDAFLTTSMDEAELQYGDIHYFECKVTLEGTDYIKVKQVPYYPNAHTLPKKSNPMDDDDDDNGNDDGAALDIRPSVATIIILASALLVLCW